MIHLISLLSVILIVSSLEASGSPQDILPRGRIIDTVVCASDSSQSYALYLPSIEPSESQPLPIIYIFDPGARGRHAIDVFRDAAERFNYILVCSNNARNGSWDLVFDAADAIFKDTEQKLTFDPLRRYTAGFSGGSRAATALAVLADGKIRGVIGCGAGYPPVINYQPDSTDRYFYLGLVGHKDMNFLEHHVIRDDLNRLGIENDLIYFNGGHQWPPKNIIAMALLELHWRHGSDLPNTWLAKYLRALYDNAEQMNDLGFSNYAHRRLTTTISNIQIPMEKYQQLTNQISETTNLKGDARKDRKIAEREQLLISKYLSHFRQIYEVGPRAEIDFTWWKDEIVFLQNLRDDHDRPRWSYLGARMLNLIAARSAESAFRYEKERQFHIVHALINIWIFADSNSPQPYWYKAKIAAIQDKQSMAIAALEEALRRGLTGVRAFDHPAFHKLRELSEFKVLKAQLK